MVMAGCFKFAMTIMIVCISALQAQPATTKPDSARLKTGQRVLTNAPDSTQISTTQSLGLQQPQLNSMSILLSPGLPVGPHTTFDDLLHSAESQNNQQRVFLDFQNSTAYKFHYADEVRDHDNVKREFGNYGGMVPIMPMVVLMYYGTKAGYNAIKGTPAISFDETDVELMNIIWEKPGLSATEYYDRYNESEPEHSQTFMTLHQRIEKLVSQKLIETRTVGIGENKQRYEMRFTRAEIFQILDEELRRNSAADQLSRRNEILKMRDIL